MVSHPCIACGQTFVITSDDLAFYEKVSPIFNGKKELIPPPTHCPECRQQRRLAWRNEQHLYKRSCDLCQKSTISVHSEHAPFPVYCTQCWWGDGWDPLSFGIAVDKNMPLLPQLKVLLDRVPHLAMQNDNGISSENSEYCYDISRAKNCYRLIGSWYDEECHYGLNINHCKFVVDSNTIGSNSELVYESLDSQKLYHCAYLQNSENCHDCFFGYDLKGCSDCLSCVGIRQKKFCINNIQYSEPEYREHLSRISFGSRSTVDNLRETFDTWSLTFPRRAANFQNCEDCLGNNLLNCKNVLGYSVFNSEHSKFIDRSDGPKYCYDIINSGGPEWCYDCVTPDDSYMTLFSVWCWKSKNVILSDNCHSSEQLLACAGIHRGKFCILNTQYTEDEYNDLAPQLIQQMTKDGVWGEHPPVHFSPFGYNESAAMDYYPLVRNAVVAKEWKWEDNLPYTVGKQTIERKNIPDDISDIPDSIVNEILSCSVCDRNFKIIPQELSFYRSMPIPLPRACFQCRHRARFQRKTPTRIWSRECAKCRKPIATSYSPERPETVYCERCYLETVY